MAPMTAILLCDFYVIKKGRYNVRALYDPRGIYYYKVYIYTPDAIFFNIRIPYLYILTDLFVSLLLFSMEPTGAL